MGREEGKGKEFFLWWGINSGGEQKDRRENQKREREIERKKNKRPKLINEINPWKGRRSSLAGFENIT